MANILVLPEFGLVADPMIGIITSAGESLSPVIEKVAIYRDHNLEHSKNIAKKLAGIPCEECTKGLFRAKDRWY